VTDKRSRPSRTLRQESRLPAIVNAKRDGGEGVVYAIERPLFAGRIGTIEPSRHQYQRTPRAGQQAGSAEALTFDARQ